MTVPYGPRSYYSDGSPNKDHSNDMLRYMIFTVLSAMPEWEEASEWLKKNMLYTIGSGETVSTVHGGVAIEVSFLAGSGEISILIQPEQ